MSYSELLRLLGRELFCRVKGYLLWKYLMVDAALIKHRIHRTLDCRRYHRVQPKAHNYACGMCWTIFLIFLIFWYMYRWIFLAKYKFSLSIISSLFHKLAKVFISEHQQRSKNFLSCIPNLIYISKSETALIATFRLQQHSSQYIYCFH